MLSSSIHVDLDLILEKLGMLNLLHDHLTLSLKTVGKADHSLTRLVSQTIAAFRVDFNDALVSGGPDWLEVFEILDLATLVQQFEVDRGPLMQEDGRAGLKQGAHFDSEDIVDGRLICEEHLNVALSSLARSESQSLVELVQSYRYHFWMRQLEAYADTTQVPGEQMGSFV